MHQPLKPLVGIPCDVNRIGLNKFHAVGEKYINAVATGADVLPLLIPAFSDGEDMHVEDQSLIIDQILERIDGLFLSGSPSNIQPHHYGNESSMTPDSHDPQRDDLNLHLIREAINRKIPILAVCRGMQELNVALGGTLYQKVHEQDGMMNHRENPELDRAGQYSKAHEVTLLDGSYLAQITGKSTIEVNSLHGQGVRTLGNGLIAEALAPDGLIEAVKLENGNHFVLAVQWHPEWQFQDDEISTALFRAFGDAIRQQ